RGDRRLRLGLRARRRPRGPPRPARARRPRRRARWRRGRPRRGRRRGGHCVRREGFPMTDTAFVAHDTDPAVHDKGVPSHQTSTAVSHEKLAMWVFLGSRCLLFGGLISTYLLLRHRSVSGPGPEDVFDIPFTSVSSFVLLFSSLTMAM